MTTTIMNLHESGGPSAIARLVVSVVVDSVDGQPFGSISHIGIEIGEVKPSLAHGDAATTVKVPVLVPRIRAALNHGGPDIVRRSTDPPSHSAPRLAVCRALLGHAFSSFLRHETWNAPHCLRPVPLGKVWTRLALLRLTDLVPTLRLSFRTPPHACLADLAPTLAFLLGNLGIIHGPYTTTLGGVR